jgi:hypothetical protein
MYQDQLLAWTPAMRIEVSNGPPVDCKDGSLKKVSSSSHFISVRANYLTAKSVVQGLHYEVDSQSGGQETC